MAERREVFVLGSTGSVGTCAASVLETLGAGCSAAGLMARRSDAALLEQALRLRPRALALTDPAAFARLTREAARRGLDCDLLCDPVAVRERIADDDVTDVLVAVPGVAGLPYTLHALRCGKRVLLANKESLVVAGSLIAQILRESGAEMVPLDSEHNALHQLLSGQSAREGFPRDVRSIVLTASGGPFRSYSAKQLASVTPKQACEHPVWSMGRKISVDSATLMNKGLEVIEAHWLFGAPPEKIQVVIHPQSVVHAIVEYVDGNSVAHMGLPDMRLPIATALSHPSRVPNGLAAPDWRNLGSLTFEEPRAAEFPCLDLAYESLRIGGGATAALNAANEVAVERFLKGEIGFTLIPGVVEQALRGCDLDDGSYDALMATDSSARRIAREIRA